MLGFPRHPGTVLPSIAFERKTISRLMPARAAASAAAAQSTAKSPGTFAPILISFSLRLDGNQSLIGSGVASVRRKLIRGRRRPFKFRY